MSEELRTVVALTALAVLSAIALAALVLIVSSLRAVARDMRRLHIQQATVVRMLLRAGFRPPSSSADWLDDADRTRSLDEPWYTRFDWRKP